MITGLLKENVPLLQSLRLRASCRICLYGPRGAVQKYWQRASPSQRGCWEGCVPGGGVSLGPRDIEDPMLALRTRMLFVVTTVREFLCSQLGPA